MVNSTALAYSYTFQAFGADAAADAMVLFPESQALVVQGPTPIYRLVDGERLVEVAHQRDIVAECVAHGLDNFFGSSRPLIDVVTAFACDAEFKRVIAKLLT